MRIAVGLLAVAVLLGSLTLSSEASHIGCHTGQAAGFVTIRSDPPSLVTTIPSQFRGDAGFFFRRYNCTGRSAQVRRVDLGVYEIRFPGLQGRLALVSAISEEGISASVHPLEDGVYRVALRGPIQGISELAARRDVAFSIVVY